jgi:hypothetical protein
LPPLFSCPADMHTSKKSIGSRKLVKSYMLDDAFSVILKAKTRQYNTKKHVSSRIALLTYNRY